MTSEIFDEPQEAGELIGRIPVRNLWLLLLYASDLGSFLGRFEADVEEAPDLPSLIARLLSYAVERRLRRNLSRNYIRKEDVLTRVRGRIDIMRTYSHGLLSQGLVACRFEDHTINTPRNRLVRAALDAVATRISDTNLAHRCRNLAGDLGRIGVSGVRPSREELAADQIARHDADDRLMVTLAKIVFDLVLPTEDAGDHSLTRLERDEILVRKLFEKAVGNFFAAELDASSGWRIYQGKWFYWPMEEPSAGIDAVMPNMKTDIILDRPSAGRRIVIDTKFTGIFAKTAYREAVLKSGYIYQIFAYLRTQEKDGDPLSNKAEGILLHPVIDADVDESVTIQGHRIRFMTVNLARPSTEILARLRSLPEQEPQEEVLSHGISLSSPL
ncbi:5-methylcytosine-specific restriction endonuclease system specificity protein McrC [Nitrobacter vulgaris]|uniref:5-methylcytosine-specific restriction endonuclease system specificity protein McrC n=1 Tax=Nitrobacter vulgaris TaxID=29421 RepID=UPI001FCD0EF6|nr:5-methylcytosine-specific restriction endonuclease system specificity protein McrC [Nitrobacter vulgaris]